jgi:hypothetical protein
MSSAEAVLSNFGSDQWDAKVYAVVSMAARLSALVKNRAQTFHLAFQFWRLNSALSGFFDEIRDVMEGKKKSTATPATPEQIEDGIRSLRKAHVMLETLYESARRSRLTNNSLIAMPLRSVHTYSDDILELAQLLEAFQSKDGVEAAFDRSAQERARGEIYNLAEVE